jgi:hypothetical protein
MKGCEFSKVGLMHVNVETLALVNICYSISSHVNKGSLLDFPYSPDKKPGIEVTNKLGKVNIKLK